jgi:deoxycytidine triphosphate deaminase
MKGVLNDKQIVEAGIFDPMSPDNLNPFGYDLTLDYKFKRAYHALNESPWQGDNAPLLSIDVFDLEDLKYENLDGDCVEIPPGDFILGSTIEYVRMPEDVLGLCFSRSSLVRLGLNVNITPFEASFEGIITIEMFNAAKYPIKVHAGMRIAQACFFRGETPNRDYITKGGRYQGQTGVTGSKGA